MTAVIEQLRAEYPNDHRNQEIGKLVPLPDAVLGNPRPILLMFLSGAALLLVIACMNVAPNRPRGNHAGSRLIAPPSHGRVRPFCRTGRRV
jgi:hypothetical protein